MMVKTPEKEEEGKQNAKRKHHNAPLMNHSTVLVEEEESESSKRRLFPGNEIPVKPKTPRIKIAESSNKLAELGFGHGKNHSTSLEKQSNLDDNEEEEVKNAQIEEKLEEEEKEEEKKTQIEEKFEEEEEVKKTQIEKNFLPPKCRYKNQSASEKKKTILDDKGEELDKMGSKRRNLDGESRTPQTQIAGKSKPMSEKLRKPKFDGKNQSASEGKKTILDDKEEEMDKMGTKRRDLDGESRTPRTQIAGKSRIGYSIDGKKLLKPAFGYSIDGKVLPKYPQIKNVLKIIGACSKPFEKKLLKTDVDKIGLDMIDVKNGILPNLKDDEKAKLSKGGILVNTYDEFGNRYEMQFMSYHNRFYKLCNGWERLYEYHQLKENEDCYVAVWMFRNKHTDEVCFAVTLKR